SLEKNSQEVWASRINLVDVLDNYINTVTNGLFLDIEKDIFMAFITGECKESLARAENNIISAAQKAFGIGEHIGVSNKSENWHKLRDIYIQSIKAIKHAKFFNITHNRVVYAKIKVGKAL